jgi:hypothetical protein
MEKIDGHRESRSHGVAQGLAPVLSPYGQSHEDNLGRSDPAETGVS